MMDFEGAGRSFTPPRLLRNGHAMTIVGGLRPRFFFPFNRAHRPMWREFRTEPETRVAAWCHWQDSPRRHSTVLIVHGLESSSDADYVLGTAQKAFRAGFNVLRYNVRGCGGTAHLTPKLYHSGLTVDLHYVVRELIERDGLPEIFVIGYSMGGNQSLKYAGELGDGPPRQLRGICAISPPIDLETCARAIRMPENRIYESRFLRSLKQTIREKDRLFPGRYDLSGLHRIEHLWDWDDHFQPYNGFRDAKDYYDQASSLSFLPRISLPALIVHAQDDPFIPYGPFTDPRLTRNRAIRLLGPRHGGHVAFFSRRQLDEDRAWAENRAVEFCLSQSSIRREKTIVDSTPAGL